MKTAAAAVLFVVLLSAAVEAATLPADASEDLQKSKGLALVEEPKGSYAVNGSASTAGHAIATVVGNVDNATDGAADGFSNASAVAKSSAAANGVSAPWDGHAVGNTSSDAAINSSVTAAAEKAKHPIESFNVKAFIDDISKFLGISFETNSSIGNASQRLNFDDDAAILVTSPLIRAIVSALRSVLNYPSATTGFDNANNDAYNSLATVNALANVVSKLFGSRASFIDKGDSIGNRFGAAITALLSSDKSDKVLEGDDSSFGVNAGGLRNIFGKLFHSDVGVDSEASGERLFDFPVSVISDLVGKLFFNSGARLSSSISSSSTASDLPRADVDDLGSAFSGLFGSGASSTGEDISAGLGAGAFGDVVGSVLGSRVNAAGSGSSGLNDAVASSQGDAAGNAFASAAYSARCIFSGASCGADEAFRNLFGGGVSGLDIAQAG